MVKSLYHVIGICTQSNVEIECDGTCGRLCISGKYHKMCKLCCDSIYYTHVYGNLPEMRNLPHVTSCLISKLESVYNLDSHSSPKSRVSSHSTVLGIRPASLRPPVIISCSLMVCQSTVSVNAELCFGAKDLPRQSGAKHWKQMNKNVSKREDTQRFCCTYA